MTSARHGSLVWRKSSYSLQGNCVEVARDGNRVLVRDSKDPLGPQLTFTPSGWAAFVGLARRTRP